MFVLILQVPLFLSVVILVIFIFYFVQNDPFYFVLEKPS